jgi:hypothetical protein
MKGFGLAKEEAKEREPKTACRLFEMMFFARPITAD